MTLHEKRQRAGQLGGITTALRHEGKHRTWGQRGGRPRSLTLAEYEARRAKGDCLLPNNLRALRKMCKEIAYETPIDSAELNRRNRRETKGEPRATGLLTRKGR